MVCLRSSLRAVLVVFGVLMVACAPVFAGSAIVGSVSGSINASVGGHALLPNSTLFSGDTLKVAGDGGAVVSTLKGSRLTFGNNAVASFVDGPGAVTVVLNQGGVALNRPASGDKVRVKVGDVSITPVEGFNSIGEVAMNGDSALITAKEGSLNVESDNGKPVNVAKGKTITVAVKNARGPQTTGSSGVSGGITPLQVVMIAGAAGGIIGSVYAIVNHQRIKDLQQSICSVNNNISPFKPVSQCQ